MQFAHYLGYFLMAIPAGWLAAKLGYKGGIIVGLLIVALGGMWFIPATEVSIMAKAGAVLNNVAFAAFLAGVCLIATGLTFLETVANPYATGLPLRSASDDRTDHPPSGEFGHSFRRRIPAGGSRVRQRRLGRRSDS